MVHPEGQNSDAKATLTEVTRLCQQQGLRLPLLVRFTDILQHRVNHLQDAFQNSITQQHYSGHYSTVYPIKVNQQRRVIEALLDTPSKHDKTIGLEAGSKAELLAVLSQLPPATKISTGIIICNGYKDQEYIQLALLGSLLGHTTYIVVEKLNEITLILEESRALNIRPLIGLRVRLDAISKGAWQNSGGEKSKFGLSTTQLLEAVQLCKQNGYLDQLRMLHFHLGSQIVDLEDIERSMTEACRYYQELLNLGTPIDCVDVGGGLGVDYEGSSSKNYFSMNYSVADYASTIVKTLSKFCLKHQIPHPNIISESGRALTAHHAVLISNVIECEKSENKNIPVEPCNILLLPLKKSHDQIINAGTNQLDQEIESCHQSLCQQYIRLQSDYISGRITLKDKADGETLYQSACIALRSHTKPDNSSHKNTAEILDAQLASKLFLNFSLFQSIPDSWGIGQIFPVLPLEKLNQQPTNRIIIEDITCDSDGRINHYVDGQGIENSLPVPEFQHHDPYHMGIFMIGAYQEILGDMHNLFGDTDSIDVNITSEGKINLLHPIKGDSVKDVLRYVNFDPLKIHSLITKKITSTDLPHHIKENLIQKTGKSLQGYTYLLGS